jgi:hypothetical protein
MIKAWTDGNPLSGICPVTVVAVGKSSMTVSGRLHPRLTSAELGDHTGLRGRVGTKL